MLAENEAEPPKGHPVQCTVHAVLSPVSGKETGRVQRVAMNPSTSLGWSHTALPFADWLTVGLGGVT